MCPGSCGKLWLVPLNNSEGWEETETCYSGIPGTVFGPFYKEGCSIRRHLYIGAEEEEG